MKKLLAVLLSITLLASSVTPSLAQIVPIGRQVIKGAAKGGGEAAVSSASKQMLKRLPKGVVSSPSGALVKPYFSDQVSGLSSVSPVGNAKAPDLSQLGLSVEKEIQQQVLLKGKDIRSLVKEGQTEGLADRILNYPNLAFREGLLRNEFVTLALKGAATPGQIAQAVQFYRTDLKKRSALFAKLPQEDMSSLLKIAQQTEHPSYETVSQAQQALSSAAALGLLGAEKDASLLLDFYKQASQSIFKETAAVIAARGMLRQGAYEELKALAALAPNESAVWEGVAEAAQQRGISVPSQSVSNSMPQADPSLSVFLRAGCEPNALNANLSPKATEKWLALGTRRAAEQAGTAASMATAADVPLAKMLEVPMPELAVMPTALTVPSLTLSGAPQFAAAERSVSQTPSNISQKTVQFFTKTQPASSSSGTLYSGLPVFGMGKVFKQAGAWLRGKFGRKTVSAPQTGIAAKEEPGLHDNSQIQEVFSVLETPEFPASADEVLGASEKELIPVSEKGFKLTLIEEDQVERILPVNLEISNRFRLKGYNRIAFTAHKDFHNGYVAELRNQTQNPLTMDHFYMRLQTNQVGTLVALLRSAGIEKFSLKLEERPNIEYQKVNLPVYDFLTGKQLPLEVEIPAKKYIEGSKLVLLESGELGFLNPSDPTHPLVDKKMYVRIPKNQIANLVEVLRFSPTVFNISMHPTQNRVDLVMTKASLTNVSLGKTMGPVVNENLGMTENGANSMMFTISYVLPGLASLLTPVLKRYGEKKMMVLSLIMSSAAGVLASAGGFYGFVEGMTLGPVSKGLFVAALFLMSGSSILKQLVSNMLIRANRGEAILKDAAKGAEEIDEALLAKPKKGFARIGQRVKQVLTKKSKVSLKDIVLYNMSFVYKNVGTLAFLASPYLINYGILLSTGVDLGIDYSVSFPIYALYSGTVAWKMWRAKLRDAYSAKNLEQSQKNLEGVLNAGAKALSVNKGALSSVQIDDASRAFKDALDALIFADLKLDPTKKKAQLYTEAKDRFLQQLETKLVQEQGLAAGEAKDVMTQVKHSISIQENTLGNMLKMFKVPGVTSLASAMTLATVHEFVISSTFSSTMKQLVSQGEFANFLIACSLYVPLIAGRLGGNFLSRRVSADTMYILCSGFSALGTLVMATAGNSVAQIITGAAIASFGVGNFFTQMYDYIMNRYPKHNRELSSILALTMALGGLGAIPAGYLATVTGLDVSSLLYAGGALAASLVLTPKMMANSTLVQALKYEGQRLWKGLKKLFKRNNGRTPGEDGNLDDAAPVQ